jgi:SRSO17 transposase
MALEMLKRAKEVSFNWVGGDCVYGDGGNLRNWIEDQKKSYVMGVSGKAYVWIGGNQMKVGAVLAALTDADWTRLSSGEGTKGEKLYDWKIIDIDPPPNEEFERCLLIRRSISDPDEVNAFLCFYRKGTPLQKLAEISGIRWTIEQSFEESKGEVGLDQYEVRTYNGWYRHITLAMSAHAIISVTKAKVADTGRITYSPPPERLENESLTSNEEKEYP